MFEMKDILNHPLYDVSKLIPEKINNNIDGRVCMTNYLHSLYLIRVLMGSKPIKYLETGVFFGGSMLTAMQCKYPTKFVGVDFFEGYYQKPFDPKTKKSPTLNVVHKNIKRNNVHNHEYELIKGSSADDNVIKYVRDKYPKINLLFIDGDHSYDGVISDFYSYSDLVEKDGILIFDNYGCRGWPEVEVAVADCDLSGWNKIGRYGDFMIFSRR